MEIFYEFKSRNENQANHTCFFLRTQNCQNKSREIGLKQRSLAKAILKTEVLIFLLKRERTSDELESLVLLRLKNKNPRLDRTNKHTKLSGHDASQRKI